jgi:hypothetical protein
VKGSSIALKVPFFFKRKEFMKDAKFMTAKEKEAVLRQWTKFVKNGFKWNDFTDSLYKHLSLHCSFIAHYNRAGFYAVYFKRPETTAKFISQFDKDRGCRSVEYSGYSWIRYPEFNDLNSAMCDAIEPYKRAIYLVCESRERKNDLKSLLQKHGIIAPDFSVLQE